MTKLMRIARLGALVGLAAVVAPSVARAQVPAGRYECYYFTSPRPGLNFTVTGNASYTDVEGTAGTLVLSGAQMTFRGGALDGQRAVYKGGNPPTVSILGPRGDEVSVCQLAR